MMVEEHSNIRNKYTEQSAVKYFDMGLQQFDILLFSSFIPFQEDPRQTTF